MLGRMIESSDPLVDVEDNFPLLPTARLPMAAESTVSEMSPIPLGFRLAVNPVRAGAHGKSYTTVTVIEDTERCDDGKVYTIPDSVEREQEID